MTKADLTARLEKALDACACYRVSVEHLLAHPGDVAGKERAVLLRVVERAREAEREALTTRNGVKHG